MLLQLSSYYTSVLLLLTYYHVVIAQDSCCSTVRLSTNGVANSSQSIRLGSYDRVDTFFDRPVYLHRNIDEYLFYMGGRSRGLWMVGPEVGRFSGGLANRGDTQCVEDVKQVWKFADGSGWTMDPLLQAQCEKDQSECLYADDTKLVGEGNTLNSEPLVVTKTAECIDACINTWGCNYWTVEKSDNDKPVKCTLKSWKGRQVQEPGFISGSLPSNCYKSQDEPENEDKPTELAVKEDEKNPCVYVNLEFKGGDLSVIPSLGFAACKLACQKLKDCAFFTINKVACVLKDANVEIHRKTGVISGATDSTCDRVLQHKNEIESDDTKQYADNEINGKFRITSEEWTEQLQDQNSIEFQELSTTLKSGLKELLEENQDLKEKANFDVEIVKLTKGSVVCNFKIRYILKEAFVAVPFSIKPSNITVTLGQGFQFKKGILFQRFVIARGSFKASSPVDHCDAKGCSHKCAYDYELEDYRCTCPPNLYLSDDDRTCREASNEITTTTQSSIAVALLPTDCLWSEWSDWSPCSSTCGSARRFRDRKVIIPARNGGKCDGQELELYDCPTKACQDVTSTTPVAPVTTEMTERTRDEPRAFSFETTTAVEFSTETILPEETTMQATEKAVETTMIPEILEDEIITTEPSFGDKKSSTTPKIEILTELAMETTTVVPKLDDEEVETTTMIERVEVVEPVVVPVDVKPDCDDDEKEVVTEVEELTTEPEEIMTTMPSVEVKSTTIPSEPRIIEDEITTTQIPEMTSTTVKTDKDEEDEIEEMTTLEPLEMDYEDYEVEIMKVAPTMPSEIETTTASLVKKSSTTPQGPPQVPETSSTTSSTSTTASSTTYVPEIPIETTTASLVKKSSTTPQGPPQVPETSSTTISTSTTASSTTYVPLPLAQDSTTLRLLDETTTTEEAITTDLPDQEITTEEIEITTLMSILVPETTILPKISDVEIVTTLAPEVVTTLRPIEPRVLEDTTMQMFDEVSEMTTFVPDELDIAEEMTTKAPRKITDEDELIQMTTEADEATESTIEFGEEEDIESTTILPEMDEELTTIQPEDELDEDIDETTVPVVMTMDTTTSTFSPMLDQETTSTMVEEEEVGTTITPEMMDDTSTESIDLEQDDDEEVTTIPTLIDSAEDMTTLRPIEPRLLDDTTMQMFDEVPEMTTFVPDELDIDEEMTTKAPESFDEVTDETSETEDEEVTTEIPEIIDELDVEMTTSIMPEIEETEELTTIAYDEVIEELTTVEPVEPRIIEEVETTTVLELESPEATTQVFDQETTEVPEVEETTMVDQDDEEVAEMTTFEPIEETELEMTTIKVMMSEREEMTFVTKTTIEPELETTLAPEIETTFAPEEMIDETTTMRQTHASPKAISVTDILVGSTTPVTPNEAEETTTEMDFMYPMEIDAQTTSAKPEDEIKTTTPSIIDNIVDFISSTILPKTSTVTPKSTTYVPLPLAQDSTTVQSIDESTTPKIIALPAEVTEDDTIEETTLTIGMQEPRELDEEVTTVVTEMETTESSVDDEFETTVAPDEVKIETTVQSIDESTTPKIIAENEVTDDETTEVPEIEVTTMVEEIEEPTKPDCEYCDDEGKEVIEAVTEGDQEVTTLESIIEEETTTFVQDEISTEVSAEVTTVSDIEKEETTESIIEENITEVEEEVTTLEPEITTTQETSEETTLKPIEPRLLDEEEKEIFTTTYIPEIEIDTTTLLPEIETTLAPEIETTTKVEVPEIIEDSTTTTEEPEIESFTTTLTSTTEAETEVPTVDTTTVTSTTSTTPISIPELDENILDDEEVLEVDEPEEETEEAVHTLECLPDSQEINGQIAMKCKEAAEAEPITVLINAKGLDLSTLARKNVKIVVKDYMLMEMQQRPVAVKPRRRR